MKNFKTEQTGRSMVEMLGVLAIIGVLSVGGILGYTQAMRKHQANNIVHAMNLTAMQTITTVKSSTDHLAIIDENAATYLDLNKLPTGITIIEGYLPNDHVVVKVTFAENNKEVCNLVANMLGNKLGNLTLTVPVGTTGTTTEQHFTQKQCGETGTGLSDYVVAQFD